MRPASVMNDINPKIISGVGNHAVLPNMTLMRGTVNKVTINKYSSKGHHHKSSIDSPRFNRLDIDLPAHFTSIMSIGESFNDHRKL